LDDEFKDFVDKQNEKMNMKENDVRLKVGNLLSEMIIPLIIVSKKGYKINKEFGDNVLCSIIITLLFNSLDDFDSIYEFINFMKNDINKLEKDFNTKNE